MNQVDTERTRIIFASLLFLGYNYFFQYFMHNIGSGHYHNDSRLYDICHKILPNYEKYELIGNIYIILVFLITLLKPSYTVMILFEFVAFIIPILFIRSIFSLFTVLPKSSKCVYNPYIAVVNCGCYDKIFSGHFSTVYVLSLLLNKYNIITMPIVVLLNVINVLIILSTRIHYTIDILVSFCITYLMYTNNIRL